MVSNKRVTFDKVYYPDVIDQTQMVFSHTQDMLPNIDFKWAIIYYMKSEWRKNIEKGHPHEIAEWGDMVLLKMFKDIDYPKTDLIADDFWNRTLWMADVYNALSYKYDIPFSELADVVTFDFMMWRFVCGQYDNIDYIASDIYNQFYKSDGTINYESIKKINIDVDWWK